MLDNDYKLLESIYGSMVAGSVPLIEGDAKTVAIETAIDLLYTENLHFILNEDKKEKRVYYLAVPSKELANIPAFATPLAAAFAGHPDFSGDGAYIYKFVPFAACLIRKEGTLKMMVSHLEDLNAYLEDEGHPVYDVTFAQPQTMQSVAGYYRNVTQKFAGVAGKIAALVTVAALGFAGFAGAIRGGLESSVESDQEAKVAALNSAVKQVSTVNPLSEDLGKLQKLTSSVVKAGGWVESYSYKVSRGQTEEEFVIKLPAWVTKEQIDELGQDFTTEYLRTENLIVATKVKKAANAKRK